MTPNETTTYQFVDSEQSPLSQATNQKSTGSKSEKKLLFKFLDSLGFNDE